MNGSAVGGLPNYVVHKSHAEISSLLQVTHVCHFQVVTLSFHLKQNQKQTNKKKKVRGIEFTNEKTRFLVVYCFLKVCGKSDDQNSEN